MEFEDQPDERVQVEVFRHTRDVGMAGDQLIAVVVDAAEDDRNSWEQRVAMLEDKIEGVVIGSQDHVQRHVVVFGRQRGDEQREDLLWRLAFGVHVLHMDLQGQARGIEDGAHSLHHPVGPGESPMIGVEDQDMMQGRP